VSALNTRARAREEVAPACALDFMRRLWAAGQRLPQIPEPARWVHEAPGQHFELSSGLLAAPSAPRSTRASWGVPSAHRWPFDTHGGPDRRERPAGLRAWRLEFHAPRSGTVNGPALASRDAPDCRHHPRLRCSQPDDETGRFTARDGRCFRDGRCGWCRATQTAAIDVGNLARRLAGGSAESGREVKGIG